MSFLFPPGYTSGAGGGLTSVDIADINATGTADATTFLRGDGSWQTPAGGGLTEVASTTLSGTATEIDVTGLDIDTDSVYYYELFNVANAESNVSLRFNGDTNDTGYVLYTTGARVASSSVGDTGNATYPATSIHGIIKKLTDSSGNTHIIATAHPNGKNAAETGLAREYSGDVNMTQLTFTASVSNAFGIGTKLRILKEG